MTEPISIHALREEGDLLGKFNIDDICSISIHALREEGDSAPDACHRKHQISIHALREEGDLLLLE